MRLYVIILFLIFLYSCSFDNKSGIWKNENTSLTTKSKELSEFKSITSLSQRFNKKVDLKKDFKFKLESEINNQNWVDIYFDKTNNIKNLKFTNLNQLIFKSKKITKHKSSNNLLFEDDNIILSDNIGNILVYSLKNGEIIQKFNFYKKRYKQFSKLLNLIVEENIIYVSDNIGYLYALNYKTNKILWAKNYKIPFRSNLKISENKLIAGNQNNNLFFFNKQNGEQLKLIPTEETMFKNDFINNLSINENSTFYLNTYGSLYSVNNRNLNINWYLNLNKSLNLNPTTLFSSNQVINFKDKIFVSSNEFFYIIDFKTGSIISKKKFSSIVRPVINNDYIFLITKNKFLLSMNINTGEILYSYELNDQIAKFLKTKKKNIEIKNLLIASNKIFIFLKNSYFLKLNIDGNIEDVYRLPSKIKSEPILVNGNLIFIDKKNKINIVN